MKINLKVLIAVISILFIAGSFATTLSFNSKTKANEAQRAETNILAKAQKMLKNHEVINSILNGQLVVINLWGGWCKPCLKEIPELNKMMKEFEGSGIRFLAFSAEDEESDREALKKAGIEFNYETYFLEPKTTKVWQNFALEHEDQGYPLNIIINRKGELLFYEVGYKEENIAEMKRILKKEL